MQKKVWFFTNNSQDYSSFAHADDIAQRGDICLAMLDREGNILKVSPMLSQDTNKFMAYTLGTYRYDAATDEWEVTTAVSTFGMVLFVIVSVCGVGLTCFLERMIAILFRIDRKYGQVVLVTNFISQVLMRVAFVAFYSLIFWKYNYAVLVLELCVYIGEYLVYRWWMRDLSWKRCLAFVICANTVSLVLGSALNSLILFN